MSPAEGFKAGERGARNFADNGYILVFSRLVIPAVFTVFIGWAAAAYLEARDRINANAANIEDIEKDDIPTLAAAIVEKTRDRVFRHEWSSLQQRNLEKWAAQSERDARQDVARTEIKALVRRVDDKITRVDDRVNALIERGD